MSIRFVIFLTVVACFTAMAKAAPRVPASDAEVLQTLPAKRGDPVEREMAALRALLAREPRRVEAATRLASMQLAQARRESDARLLGQAEATLAPWWTEAEPPLEVLVLRATLRQSSHDFAPALADLQSAVRRNPNAAQAWLTLATVQQVTGDLEGARASCRKLASLAMPAVAIACFASVDGASGNAAAAYGTLEALLGMPERLPDAVLAWAWTLKAEIAERLSKVAEAEAAYRQALAVDPRDAYALGAYADFLLDQGRPRDVLRLVPATTASDPLLLRYVLAARAAGAGDAAALTDKLTARLDAARARGDRVHLREEARYLLHVRRDAKAALPVARANWVIQKEPADARLVLEAAAASGEPTAARDVRAWLAATRLEDARLR
jgi:tetratricopeptide (TPR) repeat protein